MPTSLLWFRRDLRLSDHPALLAAVDAAGAEGAVVPVFVLDPRLWGPAGVPRRQFLRECLAALDRSLDGALVVRSGDPSSVVPALAAELEADGVHVSADAGPYGRRRDAAVEQALGSVPLIRTGSPYAVTPGRVTKSDGTPFRVFTPFARAWRAHGWRAPALRPDRIPWASGVASDGLPPRQETSARLPAAGEAAAQEAWERFRDERLSDYDDGRNLPATDATSRLSPYLKYGCLHPRTLLADLATARADGADERGRPLHRRTGLAGVLRRRAVAPPGDRAPRLRRAHGPADLRRRPGGRRAVRRVGRGSHRLSRSSTPGCGSCAARRGCTTGCG